MPEVSIEVLWDELAQERAARLEMKTKWLEDVQAWDRRERWYEGRILALKEHGTDPVDLDPLDLIEEPIPELPATVEETP